jgi:hypothetical protein
MIGWSRSRHVLPQESLWLHYPRQPEFIPLSGRISFGGCGQQPASAVVAFSAISPLTTPTGFTRVEVPLTSGIALTICPPRLHCSRSLAYPIEMSLLSASLNHYAPSRAKPWSSNTVLLGERIAPSESTAPLDPTLLHPERSWLLTTPSIILVHRSKTTFNLRFPKTDVDSNQARGEYTLWLNDLDTDPVLSREARYEVRRIDGTEIDAEAVARELVCGSKWDYKWSLAVVTYHPSKRPEPVGVSQKL